MTTARGRRSWTTRLLLVAVAAVLVPAWGGGAAHAETYVDDAAQELAEKYAPVVMLVTQPDPCSDEGEPYAPMSVEAVLGNPQIALRQIGNGDPVVTWGPTASDLYDLGSGFYLDFPGGSLSPDCIYEEDFHRYTADLEPTVYAHVLTQDDEPDRLVVQYWLYWYFNDWNNTHESDWEGIQLVFDVGTPQEALETEPVEVGYSQHEGGERSDWGDDKLDVQDGHPVMYSSRGSHASYYGSTLYLGRSASEGFGCDSTTGPSTAIEPQVVVLPDEPSGPDDELAWLSFTGHWGEMHSSGAYSGPTGPTDKSRWTEPIEWQDSLRASSARMPASGTVSASVVTDFCSVVGWGSNLVMGILRSPAKLLVIVAVIVGVVLLLSRRTDWDVTPLRPVVRRRRAGQVLTTAVRALRSAPRTWLGIVLVALPISVAINLAVALLQFVPFVGSWVDSTSARGADRLGFSIAAGVMSSVAAYTFVSAAVTAALDSPLEEPIPLARRALRRVWARLGLLAAAFLMALIVVGVLGIVLILVPVALILAVCFQFVAQVSLVEEHEDPSDVLRRSAHLVRHRWFHTAVVLGAVALLVEVIVVLVGLLTLILIRPPFWLLSTIVVVVGTALAPITALCACYLYGDAAAEDAEAPEPSRGELGEVGSVRVAGQGEA